LSDSIRLSILDLLGAGEQCVCDLQKALLIAPNLLSYHLRILRDAGLVVASRRGRWVDYRFSPDAAACVIQALPSALADELADVMRDATP